jgi:hypothetical protein
LFSLNRKVWLVVLTILLPFSVALVLAEFSLKKIEKYQQKHQPQKLLDYGDTVRPGGLGQGGYLQENFTGYVTDGLGGTVRWHNNASGFRHDQEVSQEPSPNVLRILSMGDSFVAGYRVGQEETFSFLLEQWINQKLGESEVLVSEIEEPITGLYYLSKSGLVFHPHIVLMGITIGNDLTQSYIALDPRGGYILKMDNGNVTIEKTAGSIGVSSFENYEIPELYFQMPSKLETEIINIKNYFKKYRLIRRLYQDSEGIMSWYQKQHRPKLFDMTNGLAMFLTPLPPMVEEAYERLFKIIIATQMLCNQHHIVFAVELFPQRFQVQPRDWDNAMEKYSLRKSGFDLMEPNRKIREFCREHKIILIDPTEAMAQRFALTGKNMYLPDGDMHWSREGHRAFFECSQPAFARLVQEGFKLVKSVNSDFLSPAKGSSPSTPDRHSNQMGSGAPRESE